MATVVCGSVGKPSKNCQVSFLDVLQRVRERYSADAAQVRVTTTANSVRHSASIAAASPLGSCWAKRTAILSVLVDAGLFFVTGHIQHIYQQGKDFFRRVVRDLAAYAVPMGHKLVFVVRVVH